MSGLAEDAAAEPVKVGPEYSILKQRVDLDVGFANRSLRGSTEITVQPLVKELKDIRLHCRQCRPTAVQAGGITASYSYDDPYRLLHMPVSSNVHQHEMLKSKLQKSLQPTPEPELVITLPSKLKIQELHVDPIAAQPQAQGTPRLQRQDSDAMALAETPTFQAAAQQQPQMPQFSPIKLFIDFEVGSFRDGIHWIGFDDGDKRYPYCYTKAHPTTGTTSCVFPCVDDATSRCSWEISIRCPRTLADAFKRPTSERNLPNPTGPAETAADGDVQMVNGIPNEQQPAISLQSAEEYLIDISNEDAALDLAIVCVGVLTDDVADTEDESRHTVNFMLTEQVAARHIGFAIGPFEHVDLSADRTTADEEKLGASAVRVDGYCLPSRSEELRDTCFPVIKVIDNFAVSYGGFPFSSYQILFVDDFTYDAVAIAGLSFCSTRLLFPYEVLEPIERNTRIIVRTIAEQWIGVNVIANEPCDAWVIAAIAGYMTDLYGVEIFGNNGYRWQQKLAAEKVYDLDVDRPSIYELGNWLHLDKSIREFLDLKSALVLFILDRRLLKSSGSSGIKRIINKIFLNAKTGSLVNGELSTADFQRTCEKLGHNKLESFFKQWVFGAGVPIFFVTQRFNKKKLVVEMTITQKQLERVTKPPFEPSNFMREVKEHVQEVYSGEVQPVFSGPMTIRIHEADGTPYEHIVEIKEAVTKLEIPYNTKYKRLKRSRRQRERVIGDGATGEDGQDALLYCLGDILDTPEAIRDWNLAEWSEEDEEKMGQESYEWIRMDADFEWIGKIHLVMPLYMYVSQLQQDRDLVAQYESMRYLLGSNPHHISLTILVRTLMDQRYFHGIRTMAADGLAICAKKDVHDIGTFHLIKAFEEMFCFPGEIMPKPNDWSGPSGRIKYVMQCTIPKAMSKLRDAENKVPMAVRKFFLDKLKFNDNSSNEFSDCHYVSTLMRCLADSIIVSHREPQPSYTFNFGGEEEPIDTENPDAEFEMEAIDEIERYRRIDEYETTYQNIYSVTALECLQQLTKAGLVKDKTKEVLQHTRKSNADLVRLAAFKCLNEIGLTRRMSMMKHLLHSVVDDGSPFVRDSLLQIFGEALGHIALGDSKPQKVAEIQPPADGLVLEQEASTEDRHLEVTRRTTPEGALIALKAALSNEDVFKQALWYAITSPNITLEEASSICDTASLIYEAVDSYVVILKLPRSYRVERTGKATVLFIPHGSYRIEPRKGLGLEDWQRLQSLELKYSGPLSEAVTKTIRGAEEKKLKLQIEDVQRQAEVQQASQPPPVDSPRPARVEDAITVGATHTVAATPTIEKSGIRLSLGSKRKQSVDLTPRSDSPKAPKLSRQQTPNGYMQTTKTKGSPNAAGHRRGSTPGSKSSAGRQGQREPIRLRLGTSAMARAQEILGRPPRPGQSRLIPPARPEQARSSTPHVTQPSSLFPGSLLTSPTSNNFFSASPQQAPTLNLGAFRSYGAVPDADVQVAAEVKQEYTENAGTPPINVWASSFTPPPPSVSPPTQAVDNQSMPPPPRPKVLLKLGSRKPDDAGTAEHLQSS